MSVTRREIQPGGRDLGPTGSSGTDDAVLLADAIADALPAEDGGDNLIVAPPVETNVIHGDDNRQEMFKVTDKRIVNDADCVVAMIRAKDITPHPTKAGWSNITTRPVTDYYQQYGLCPDERFAFQPAAPIGTGFLVGRDVVATARHVVEQIEGKDVRNIRFVFGYRMLTDTTARTSIANSQIYSGVQVLAQSPHTVGADWALVRLDRPVPDHRVANVRRSGMPALGTPVHAIGHPKGLPLKLADQAVVTKVGTSDFLTNLDTFQGNSGCPVFNSLTHEVEGILVRGISGQDFTLDSDLECLRWAVAASTDTGSSECTRASVLATALAQYVGPGWQELDDSLATVAVAASGSQLYRLTSGGQVYRYAGTPYTGWNLLHTSGAAEIVADGSLLYRRQRISGAIFRYTVGPFTTWEQIGGNSLTILLAAGGGRLYQLMSNGEMWCYTNGPGAGWVQLDNNWQTKALAADGTNLYQLHKNGQIYQYLNIPMSGWLMLDNNTKTKAIVAAGGKLYQLHDTGQVWQYTGVPLIGWALLASGSNTQEIATDGADLYRRDGNGHVYRYTGTPLSGWQRLDDSSDTIAIAATGGRMYQLRNSGTSGSLRRLVK